MEDEELRRRIIIPDDLPTERWRLEAPVHYRASAEVLAFVDSYIEISSRLLPVAFMGGFFDMTNHRTPDHERREFARTNSADNRAKGVLTARNRA